MKNRSVHKQSPVTLIQRFGGALNLNVHFHQLFVDGVYGLDASRKLTQYQGVSAPSLAELDQVLQQIITRVTRYLERQVIIVRDEEEHLQLNLQDDEAFSRLQASSSVYRFLMGPNKGKKTLVLKTVVDSDHSSSQGLVVKASGFSLHAGASCKAEERLSVNQKGQVVYKLKKAYEDGTTHIVMEPMELLEKLSALIPRPRVHLTRFHGILAPHDKHRKLDCGLVFLRQKNVVSYYSSLREVQSSRSTAASGRRF